MFTSACLHLPFGTGTHAAETVHNGAGQDLLSVCLFVKRICCTAASARAVLTTNGGA